jgi:ACR3 family arsenite efflux pump ArsB
MKKWIENLILGAMGAIAVVGLMTVIVAIIIGKMDYQQINYISLSGE